MSGMTHADTMKVRVLTDFGSYLAGSVFEWDRGLAELLIQRGFIEEVSDLETATEAPMADERAMIDHKHGRKRR